MPWRVGQNRSTTTSRPKAGRPVAAIETRPSTPALVPRPRKRFARAAKTKAMTNAKRSPGHKRFPRVGDIVASGLRASGMHLLSPGYRARAILA